MSKNSRCVFVANAQAEAMGITLLLENEGIEVVLIDKTTLGISYGISFSSDEVADGWQVWVKEASQAEEAKRILSARTEKKERNAAKGPVTASCDRCGQTSQFEGQFRGTVQNCPFCKRFMDVGGADDEFDWPDSIL